MFRPYLDWKEDGVNHKEVGYLDLAVEIVNMIDDLGDFLRDLVLGEMRRDGKIDKTE
jgi:hypothetical protein